MLKLAEVKKESLIKNGILISPGTIKGWWNRGKHLDLKVKIEGRTFLNVDKFFEKFGLTQHSQESNNEG